MSAGLIEGFDLVAGSIGGIPKLRELILKLAVRGQLVLQDPNDEPVASLQKRICGEKERLIKEGRIKRDRLQRVTDDLKPYDLPVGWEWVRLGEIAWPQAGFAFKSGFFNEKWDGVPLIRIRDVGSNNPATYFSGEFRSEFLVRAGDWLVSMDGTFRVAEWSGPQALLNQRVTRLVFFATELQRRFFCIALQAELAKLQGQKAYTTVDHLSGEQIASRLVPLPPLPEQARIVAKVEELMALCDRLEAQQSAAARMHGRWVEAALDQLTASVDSADADFKWRDVLAYWDQILRTPESLEQFERTLLQLAVRGKLAPQDSSEESADELIRRIRLERASRAASSKAKRDAKLPLAAAHDTPYELPKGWKWIRFGDVWESSLYGPRFSNHDYVEDGVPTVRTTDMSNGTVVLKDAPTVVLSDKERENYLLRNGDLLVTRSGSIGVMAIFDLNCDAIPSAYLIRLRFAEGLCPEYFLLFLRSPQGLAQLGLGTTSVGVPNINASKMAEFVVPLPPAMEQRRIVSQVQRMQSLIAELKVRLAAATDKQAKLASALVDHGIR